MAEPENHTLRVLTEFRNEFREFRSQTEQKFARIEERLDILSQTLAGVISGSQFTLAGIQGRFESVERRVAMLEQNR